MRCPTLSELPSPPPGRTGWPWTAESEYLPETMSDGSPWPRISVVTPSFNQGAFIEETIRAVLLQGYPDIEYIVIDGGSRDNTVDILKKYQPWLSYWVSEPDRGQAHALNKGFNRSTGRIFYWINSDDYPAPGVFGLAATRLHSWPEVGAIFGNCHFMKQNGTVFYTRPALDFSPGQAVEKNPIEQQTVFFRDSVWRSAGQTNERLHFIMDYELWLRWILQGVRFKACPEITAYFRFHRESKSTNLGRINQNETIALLLDLKRKGTLGPELYPHLDRAFSKMCKSAYGNLDFPHFHKTLLFYVKYRRRPPGLSLLLRFVLSLLGQRFNRFLVHTYLKVRRPDYYRLKYQA